MSPTLAVGGLTEDGVSGASVTPSTNARTGGGVGVGVGSGVFPAVGDPPPPQATRARTAKAAASFRMGTPSGLSSEPAGGIVANPGVNSKPNEVTSP